MRAERPQFDFSVTHKDTFLPGTLEEVRILFLAKGRARVKGDTLDLTLENADYLLINVLEEAHVTLEEGSFLAILSLPYFDLLRAADRVSVRFDLCCLGGETQRNDMHREMFFLLQGLLMCFVGDIHAERLKAMGLYYLILQNLVDNFSVTPSSARQDEDREEKITAMMQYIWANYGQEITMTQIAEKIYLSRSVASRLFKQATGENFPDYLKKLRLSAVCRALERTDLSITEIALENGFSSPSVLNRTFRESFGLTPTEYRRGHQRPVEETGAEEADRRQVLEILRTAQDLMPSFGEELHTDLIRLGDAVSWKPWKNRMLNVGSFASLLSARMQQQTAFLVERLRLEYLRLWNPFAPDMMFLGEEKGKYNFAFLDEVLDFCVDQRVKLFIDLSPRRERNMANETREISFASAGERFESLEEWLDALRSFASHLRQRYQEQTVNGWVFELAFTLIDLPYHQGPYAPHRVWEESCRVIGEILPQARIAGPGYINQTDPNLDEEQIRGFFAGWQPWPDIFTSIHFPYFFSGRSPYGGAMQKDPSRRGFQQQVGRIRDLLDQCGFSGEYWVTECGISVANRNYLQDSCYRGTTLLSQAVETRLQADSVGVFYGSDLISAHSDSAGVLCGSGGLLTRNGIRKPVYYAFRFLSHLGDKRLKQTADCLATCFHPGDIRILCWHRRNLGPRYYMREEDSFRPDEIDGLMENQERRLKELEISGLEPGQRYRVRQRILNADNGGILHKWRKLGTASDLGRDDLEYLMNTCIPDVVSEDRIAEGGTLRISFRMEPNELRMLFITRD